MLIDKKNYQNLRGEESMMNLFFFCGFSLIKKLLIHEALSNKLYLLLAFKIAYQS